MSPGAPGFDDGTCPAAAGDGDAVPTVAGLLWSAADLLRASKVENPRREARILLAHAAMLDESAVIGFPERRLCRSIALHLRRLAERRAGGEPLSRIIGRREFWSLELKLSEHTLDPRPDSETLVEAVLHRIPDPGRRLRILDLGTGSGCLLLALLTELPQAVGIGIDVSYGACATAAANSRRLGLAERADFVVSDWASATSGAFDIVVSNPPYVPSREIVTLAREVHRFDPRAALCGGDDGLAAYRRIAPELARLLKSDGFAALEIGAGQKDDIAGMLTRAGLSVGSVRRDLAGIERCLVAEVEKPPFTGERGF